jgi:hypothetical protein
MRHEWENKFVEYFFESTTDDEAHVRGLFGYSLLYVLTFTYYVCYYQPVWLIILFSTSGVHKGFLIFGGVTDPEGM